MPFFFRRLLRKFRRPPPALRVMVLLLSVLAYGSTGFVYFEQSARPDLTLLDGLWYTIATVTTVGYGDLAPASAGGRLLIALPLMMVGIGLLGYVLSIAASSLVESKTKELHGMGEYRLEGHLVILNFPERGQGRAPARRARLRRGLRRRATGRARRRGSRRAPRGARESRSPLRAREPDAGGDAAPRERRQGALRGGALEAARQPALRRPERLGHARARVVEAQHLHRGRVRGLLDRGAPAQGRVRRHRLHLALRRALLEPRGALPRRSGGDRAAHEQPERAAGQAHAVLRSRHDLRRARGALQAGEPHRDRSPSGQRVGAQRGRERERSRAAIA